MTSQEKLGYYSEYSIAASQRIPLECGWQKRWDLSQYIRSVACALTSQGNEFSAVSCPD